MTRRLKYPLYIIEGDVLSPVVINYVFENFLIFLGGSSPPPIAALPLPR
jgi:hypothetical protein